MSEKIQVAIKEEGDGYIFTREINLDTYEKGTSFWKLEDGKTPIFRSGHGEFSLAVKFGSDRAAEIVKKALSNRRKMIIVNA